MPCLGRTDPGRQESPPFRRQAVAETQFLKVAIVKQHDFLEATISIFQIPNR
jgi:hypothetical protein